MPLLHRVGRGVELSDAGREVAAAAERMEEEVHAMERRLAGQTSELSGVVRVALPPLMLSILSGALRELRASWPALSVELVAGLEVANLTRREADIAIRVQAEPDEDLVGRHIGPFTKAAYRARTRSLGEDMGAWPWIDWDPAYRHFATSRWLRREHPEAMIAARVDSAPALLELAHQGVGVAFLPRAVAERDPALVRCAAPDLPAPSLWVLTHPELRHVPRIQLVLRHLSEHLARALQND